MNSLKKCDTYLKLQQNKTESILAHCLDCSQIKQLQNIFASSTGRHCVLARTTGEWLTQPEPAESLKNEFLLQCNWIVACPVTCNNLHIANWLIADLSYKPANAADNDPAKARNTIASLNAILEDSIRLKAKLKATERKCTFMHKKTLITEERYHKILNNICEAVMIFDAQNRVISANHQAFAFFEIPLNDLDALTERCESVCLTDKHGQRISAGDFPANHLFRTGGFIQNSVYGYKPYDHLPTRWIRVSAAPLNYANGEIQEVIITFEDFTHHKEKTDTIHHSIKALESSQEMALLGTYSLNITQNKWSYSPLYKKIFGLNDGFELTRESWLQLIHPDWVEKIRTEIQQNCKNKSESYNYIYKIIQPGTNTEKWIRDIGQIVPDEHYNDILGFGTVQDITDLKLAEEKALENENKYRRIFDNVRDVYYKVDPSYTILEISPSIKHMTDLTPEMVIGRNATEFLLDKDKLFSMENIMDKNGNLKDYHVTLITSTGQELLISLSANSVLNPAGEVEYYEGFVRDISYRKLMERQLRESESRLRSYFDCAPIMISITDRQNKVLEANPMHETISGYSLNEVYTINFRNFFAPESYDTLKHYMQRVVQTGSASDEVTVVCKDGTHKYMQVKSTLLPSGNIINFSIDITERKQMEESLRQNKQILEEAQQIARVGHALVSFNNHTWESSSMFDQLTGIDHTFVKTNNNWEQIIHPDDLHRVKAVFHKKTFAPDAYIDEELRIIRQDTGETRWVKALGSVHYSETGDAHTLRFTMQDITEQRRWTETLFHSERQLKAIAVQLQKVREDEKAALAREIHDDACQLLAALKMELGMMRNHIVKKTDNNETLLQFNDQLLMLNNKTISACRRIIDELRTDELEMIGLNDTLKKLIANFEKINSVKVNFTPPENSIIHLNKEQSIALYRIMQEALNNISKYANASLVSVCFELRDQSLCLTISDNGCGFDTSLQLRSNAYGLRGIRERILLLEGNVSINSAIGKGTTIDVRIPYCCEE